MWYLFSPSSDIITVQSQGDGFYDSCAITRSPEGVTTRDLLRSYECRSSVHQFCCKSDWCNSLLSPPLPALTSLKCAIGHCSSNNEICDETHYIASLSSATESCFGTWKTTDGTAHQSFKKGCVPGQIAVLGDTFPWIGESFCCNSPECNRQPLPSKLAIKCYVCDSRVTGLLGCSTLNTSSQYVYEAGSSISYEACAGRDTSTNNIYPACTIRTFIAHCENRPLGVISYGGAIFQGRINCCWKNHCNTESLDAMLTDMTSTLKTDSSKTSSGLYTIIIIGSIVVICFVPLLCIGLIIYRLRYQWRDSGYSRILHTDYLDMDQPQSLPASNSESFPSTECGNFSNYNVS